MAEGGWGASVMSSDAGKGDTPRRPQIGREEKDLRDALAFGLITKEMFEAEYARLLAEGKITRGGRVVCEEIHGCNQ